MRPIDFAVCSLCACFVGAHAAIAGAPERSTTGTTLVVPEAHAALGVVYFVETGGPDVQVTFISDAPVERVVGTSSAVVGYAVVAEDPASAAGPLLAGAFRLPVASFETGIPLRNEHLRSSRWMDAGAHPDVHFVLSAFEGATLAKQDDEKGFSTWDGNLVGALTIKGKTNEVSIPARVSLIDLGDNEMVRGGGKKLAIRCQYTVNLSDFEVAAGEMIIGTRMNDAIRIDQFLLMNPNNPDTRLEQMDEESGDDRWSSLISVRNKFSLEKDNAAGVAIAAELIDAHADDGRLMRNLATFILGADEPDLALAERAARAAVAVEPTSPLALATLAEVLFKRGDFAGAVEAQTGAVEHIDGAPGWQHENIRAALAKYERAAGG